MDQQQNPGFPQSPAPSSPEIPIRFTGSGSEYFRIWIVNLLLSIVTLGIYSAWAKVRRLKYFYGNTLVDGSPLDFHGKPIAILIGRLIGVGLLFAWVVIQNFAPWPIVLIALIGGIAVLPWLAIRAMRFQLMNTSYRGVRFGFEAKLGEAFMVFLVWPVLTVFTLYLLAPLAYQRMRRFMHQSVRYGNLPGSMTAPVGAFYRVFGMVLVWSLLALVLLLSPFIIMFISNGGFGVAIAFGIYIGFIVTALLIGPYAIVRLRNLVWNNSRLGEHRLVSRAEVLPYFRLMAVNYILILLTLGLFLPFARIRSARYLLTTMAVVPQGNLDEVIAIQRQRVGAAGEETADLFDVDLAL